MPTWRVSETYINLWITDVPTKYVASYGRPVSFRLTLQAAKREFAQREIALDIFKSKVA